MFRGLGNLGAGTLVSFIIVLLLCRAHASAAILLEEQFAYPDGPITSSSSKWTAHSGTPGEVQVLGERLRLSSANTEDIHALLIGQPHTTESPTNRFYFSFRLTITQPPSASGNYFAHLKGVGNSAFSARIWIRATPGATEVQLGVASGTASDPTALWPAALQVNREYLIVARFVNTNSAMKLWVDPAAETDNCLTLIPSGEAVTVSAFAFRQASGIGTLVVDELRVGTQFTDVVPGAPELFGPRLTELPHHQSALQSHPAGIPLTFSADPEADVRWFKDGVLIESTGASLQFNAASVRDAGFYHASVSNAIDVAFTPPVSFDVHVESTPAFSLLNYNLHGNGVLDWSTNSAQVRAIGRIVRWLNPDILTFQEIPVTNHGTALMSQFVEAYRPGFHLATNSSDDGAIRSVIISRYPIVASRSWLHGTDLTPFGYSNDVFKRDLFHAEIAVPGFPEPLHVFTLHLKSGQDRDSATQRAAEAGAVSNFFVTTFTTNFPKAPFLVTGDLNEDILRPPASRLDAIRRLANVETGLRLTTPINPVDHQELTFSTQAAGGMMRRYDYILPCGLLWSNIVSSEVFRSDTFDVQPAGLWPEDTRRASDHLPVLIKVASPYQQRPILSAHEGHTTLRISAEGIAGNNWELQTSTDLKTWTAVTIQPTSEGSSLVWVIPKSNACEFIRLRSLR